MIDSKKLFSQLSLAFIVFSFNFLMGAEPKTSAKVEPTLPVQLSFIGEQNNTDVTIKLGDREYNGKLDGNKPVTFAKRRGDHIQIALGEFADRPTVIYSDTTNPHISTIDNQASTHEFFISSNNVLWQEKKKIIYANPFKPQKMTTQELTLFKQNYPILFDCLPEKYHTYFEKKNYDNFRKFKSLNDLINTPQNIRDRIRLTRIRAVCNQLAEENNIICDTYHKGWVFFNTTNDRRIICLNTPFTTVKTQDEITLKGALNIGDPAIFDWLVNLYKIHLMPKFDDIERITITLLQEIEQDHEIRNSIAAFKIVTTETQETIERNLPRIVIYANPGKATAQLLLNKMYELFKDIQGIDKTPRFNQKITSLLYWAQGNGDDKEIDSYRKYFDQPNMICYSANFKQIFDPQAPLEDYYLVDPKKQQSVKASPGEKTRREIGLSQEGRILRRRGKAGQLQYTPTQQQQAPIAASKCQGLSQQQRQATTSSSSSVSSQQLIAQQQPIYAPIQKPIINTPEESAPAQQPTPTAMQKGLLKIISPQQQQPIYAPIQKPIIESNPNTENQ